MEIQKIQLDPSARSGKTKPQKLRVAAYCRVSTDTEDQRTSFQGQVRHYTQTISDNPEWEMAGIYADEGITGTSVAKRPQFQRMIQDCEAGRIDLILTKSISRFARNTLECLTCVRHLNSIGVHLLFESNNIDTRTAFSEMILTVLAAFAQEESRSISENTIWGIRKRYEEGITRWCKLYGYRKGELGDYVIIPEQAVVVQKIFWLYEHGKTILEIVDYLKEHKIPSPKGDKEWSKSVIPLMLSNERYAGDIILQKYRTQNHITHKAIRNDSTEVPSYYIENHHTPIVSRKRFDRCQKIMDMRRVRGKYREYDSGSCNQYPLWDKLRCPHCGSTLYQRSITVQSGNIPSWCCEKGETACRSFIIRSHLVESALLEAYQKLDASRIAEKVHSPRFGAEAKAALKMKQAHPSFQRVDYWWVDDMIDHITFGAHSKMNRDYGRLAAMGKAVTEDRTMKVYWKCGLVTTVLSGVKTDRDHPALLAELHNQMLKKKKNKTESEAKNA